MKLKIYYVLIFLLFTTTLFASKNEGNNLDGQFEIIISMTDGSTTKSTEIKYISGTTTGLDPGYDAGTFTGVGSSFSIFSHLVSDSEGVDFALQALPDSNYENMIIPIGVSANSGTQLTFSMDILNLPSSFMVFLEDRLTGLVTRLDQISTTYVTTLTVKSSGIGQFYIHTSASTPTALSATFWSGSEDSDWGNINNWSNGIPSTTITAIVNDVANNPNIDTDVTINNLIVNSNSTLTISTGKSLKVNENITNNSEITIVSDATTSGSLIVSGTATGNITYQRFLTDKWHLISAPVTGQDITDFVTGNNPDNEIAINGSNYGLAPYNNNGTAWNYYTSATLSGDFEIGKGYSVKKTTADIVTFLGEIKTENTSIDITLGTNGWNLIGNPYPSFISLNDFINTNGTNGTSSFASSYDLAYFWDSTAGSDGDYVFKNLSDSYQISPGQAFFVKANSDTSITINESMQSTQSTSFFRNTENRFEIKVKMTDGIATKSTEIIYLDNATIGLDSGYDAGVFTGTDTSFNIYSHLVNGNSDADFALQALPNSDYENMIIPIGINANPATELTFNLEIENLPSNLMVFLEDKFTNTFTRLDETSSVYTTTLATENNSIGRFYIHTSSSELLNISSSKLEDLSIYTSNKNLHIKGLKNVSTIEIYNTIGQKIFSKMVNNSTAENISFPIKVNQGIYIVQVKTENGIFTKKILL